MDSTILILILTNVLTVLGSAFLNWQTSKKSKHDIAELNQKMKHDREEFEQKLDAEKAKTWDSSVNNLLESFNKVTERNEKLTETYMISEEKRMKYFDTVISQKGIIEEQNNKIERLTRTVSEQCRKIEELKKALENHIICTCKVNETKSKNKL
ncbi:MAG: hypothetical protein FWG79_07175 [Bacteroidales bacterium]|nr:hypothetical protein [Bacteroidales bacterium]